jgi:hypothetical protein
MVTTTYRVIITGDRMPWVSYVSETNAAKAIQKALDEAIEMGLEVTAVKVTEGN